MNITSIIVEDEQHSQELLEIFLNSFCPKISIMAKTETVSEAIKLISKLKPDVVFLDIELQDGNGFDVINKFSTFQFLTIFITGYDDFSIKAIKHSAFDYILKPFSIQELRETMLRVEERLKEWKILHQIEVSDRKANINSEKLILKSSKGTSIISLYDIVYIAADEPYCKIHLINNKMLHIHSTLKNFIGLLPDFFFRIHKSYLVNLFMAKEWGNGRGGNLTLENNITLPISARRKKEFIQKIKLINNMQ